MTGRELSTVSIITLIILILNLSQPTMLQQNEKTWAGYIENHLTMAPFSLRPLVTQTTVFIANTIGISYRTSFIVIQYILLFIMFLSFAFLLRQFGLHKNDRVIGLILLGTAYPILCLHFIPNYTWDDSLLYLGIIWMSYFLVAGRVLPAAIIMLLTTLGREHILMFAPVFFIWGRPKHSAIKTGLVLLIPVLGYGFYRYIRFPDIYFDRFTYWAQNFADLPATRQSLYSLFVSFGWLWTAGVLGIHSKGQNTGGLDPKIYNDLKSSALIIAPLAVAVVLLLVKARETRIFFPPFIYIIPLGIITLKEAYSNIRSRMAKASLYYVWLVVLAASIGLSIWLFPGFPFLPILDFHRVLFALHLTLSIMLWVYSRTRFRTAEFGT